MLIQGLKELLRVALYSLCYRKHVVRRVALSVYIREESGLQLFQSVPWMVFF
jgi:hypothetical protein